MHTGPCVSSYLALSHGSLRDDNSGTDQPARQQNGWLPSLSEVLLRGGAIAWAAQDRLLYFPHCYAATQARVAYSSVQKLFRPRAWGYRTVEISKSCRPCVLFVFPSAKPSRACGNHKGGGIKVAHPRRSSWIRLAASSARRTDQDSRSRGVPARNPDPSIAAVKVVSGLSHRKAKWAQAPPVA